MDKKVIDVAKVLNDKSPIWKKEMLTSKEMAEYLGISREVLHVYVGRYGIPHYKPLGKFVFFNRKEVEEWMRSNRLVRKKFEKGAVCHTLNYKCNKAKSD